MKPANRDTKDDWQRLRRDKRSAVVVLAVIIAGLASILAVVDTLLYPTHASDRSSPIYWALLLPFSWWAASLANYTPWAVRTLRPGSAIFVVAALICLALAAWRKDHLNVWIVATLITITGTAIGVLLFPKSLLRQQSK